jgi:DNA-binding CsgD family transcriptional regulator
MPLDILGRHWATPAGICSEQIGSAYGDDFAPWRDTFFKFGIRDIVTINAYDVDGHGIAINAFHPKRVVLPPTYIEQLERVAVHLITSYRLRRAGTPNGFLADDVEAILTPDGHVHDARGEASTKREELTIATRLIERARGQLRRTTPEEALTIWRALVEARWSLVNFVDTDGKRFLIARVNDPKPTATTRLTAREHQIVSLAAHGHSNKLIGYELGIAEGTVGAHISAAMRKLGVTTRASLAALYAVETISDDHTNAKSPRT